MKNIKFMTMLAVLLASNVYAQANSHEFLALYNSAKDYRGLVDAGLNSAQNGGYFYAYQVLSECAAVKRVEASTEAAKAAKAIGTEKNFAAARQYSLKLLKSRCEKFSNEELEIGYLNKIWSDGLEKGDPLIKVTKMYTTNSMLSRQEGSEIHAKRLEAISAVIENKDPLVVQDLGLRLVISTDNKNRAVFRAHGEQSSLNAKVDLGLAASLVPCEMGLQCDKNEFSVLMPCASQGVCDESRYATVEKMTKKAGKDYPAVLAKAKEIANSIVVDSSATRRLE